MDQRHQDRQSAQFSIAYVGPNCVEISRRILCNGAVGCVVNVSAQQVGHDRVQATNTSTTAKKPEGDNL